MNTHQSDFRVWLHVLVLVTLTMMRLTIVTGMRIILCADWVAWFSPLTIPIVHVKFGGRTRRLPRPSWVTGLHMRPLCTSIHTHACVLLCPLTSRHYTPQFGNSVCERLAWLGGRLVSLWSSPRDVKHCTLMFGGVGGARAIATFLTHGTQLLFACEKYGG